MANKYDGIMGQLGAWYKLSDPQERPSSATEENLKAVEAKIGYPLPADYREFLRDHGGFGLAASYPVSEEGQEERESVSTFYGRPPDRMSLATTYRRAIERFDGGSSPTSGYPDLSLIRSAQDGEATGWPPELLPIANSGAGSSICLALFGLRPGAIFFWRNAPFSNAQNFYLVADSFDKFMHLLRKDE